jgi:hypothetical protein
MRLFATDNKQQPPPSSDAKSSSTVPPSSASTKSNATQVSWMEREISHDQFVVVHLLLSSQTTASSSLP